MSLIDLRMKDFIEEVDSSSPAPGGGSVSALAATLGVALSRMVGHLTIHKKAFQNLALDTRDEYEDHFKQLVTIKQQLMHLIDEDTRVFNGVMEAYKLPKATDEDILKRKYLIECATLEAIKVPLAIATLSYQALELCEAMIEHGSKQAISDIGVGALLLYAGLEGAVLNILINCDQIQDETVKEYYSKIGKDLIENGNTLKDVLLGYVHFQINK
jgi:methenyltetrahydrofolate cyclohydrolase